MKNPCFVLLAVVLLFSSCSSGPFDINKEGGTVFTLECEPGAKKSDLDLTQLIISRRLENFGIPESERKVYIDQQHQIVVEVARHYPNTRLRKLLQSTAELGFFETYENSAAYPYLEKLDRELANELEADSTKQFASDSLLKAHPLLGRIMLSIRDYNGNMEWEYGCRIGLVRLGDTASVNNFLKGRTASLLFPADLCWAWAVKPEKMEGAGDLLSLYVLNTKNIHYPALGGDVVTDARTDKDQYSGRLVVSLSMNEKGARQWEEITERNVKHAIAIVMDGYVNSAPVVENKIPNGLSVINGSFTVDEAEDLANVLKSSRLPVKTKIIEETTVEPKK